MKDVNWFCDLMGYKLFWYQKLVVKLFQGKNINRMKKIVDECKNNKKLFIRLPNTDCTVDLYMNKNVR